MTDDRSSNSASTPESQLPWYFRTSLVLGLIAELLAIAAGVKEYFAPEPDLKMWKLPLALLLYFLIMYGMSYAGDRFLRVIYKPGKTGTLITRTWLGGMTAREIDQGEALNSGIVANGVMLIVQSVFLVLLALVGLIMGPKAMT